MGGGIYAINSIYIRIYMVGGGRRISIFCRGKITLVGGGRSKGGGGGGENAIMGGSGGRMSLVRYV